jgi:hypothetical protein
MFSGTVTNNTGSSGGFEVVLYIDGSATPTTCGVSLAASASAPVIFFGTPSLSAGAHTFDLWLMGYIGSVTLAGTLTIS